MTVARHAFAIGLGVLLAGSLTLSPAAVASSEDASHAPASGVVRVEAAGPTALPTAAAARVSSMSLREKAASIVMGHIPTTDAAALRTYMESNQLGGFILMGANIPASEPSLRRLTRALTPDPGLVPLIAVDQEGGDVSRLPWDDFPSALTLKGEPASATRDAFAGRSGLVMRAGIGVNLGIVADETDDPSMFIYRRALGTSPSAAAQRVAAAVDGEAAQALSTLKHFPGHGAAPGDSHSVIPTSRMSRRTWESKDGLPFAAGIDAHAPILMYGHLRYLDVDRAPASMSAKWHAIARDELGFTGVSITDDLGMLEATGLRAYADPVKNAVGAIAAGNDMVLTVMLSTASTAPAIVDGIVDAVERGALPEERLEDAATRAMALRLDVTAAGRGLVPCEECAAVR